MEFKQLVTQRLVSQYKCYGHCDSTAKHVFLSPQNDLKAAIVCPQGYVSRLIAYSYKPIDQRGLLSYIEGVAPELDVRLEDIRLATRHPWDLGVEAESDVNPSTVYQAYWTQNYRRTKSDASDRLALFMCDSCGRLFAQKISSTKSKCQKCT